MTFLIRQYGKNPLICIAFIVVFGATMKTASAGATLSIFSFTLTELTTLQIQGTVKLLDDQSGGSAPRDTVVHGVWALPDGSLFDQYAVLGTRLRAEFTLYTGGVPGKYTLTIVDANSAGYRLIQKNNSQSITIAGVVNQTPTAVFNTDVLNGGVPLTVSFDSSGSTDPDGSITAYNWSFGDGSSSTEAYPIHMYMTVGSFTATLTVTDDGGATASQSTVITVTDTNAGCINNCMSIDNIAVSYKSKNHTIKGLVWPVDEHGNGIRGADVHATWTLPNGSIVDQHSKIGSQLRAKFTLPASSVGIYTLKIIEVTKEGYSFDPQNSNVMTGIIDIAP